MCGIVGAAARREVSAILVEGLKRLEYRGYDSAGVAIIDCKGLIGSYKRLGKVAVLDEAMRVDPLLGATGIAHTRWATHGQPSEENAHPHSSNSGKIAIVHNGIIENYYSIKKYLISDGCKFKSDTDTEVLSQLIGYISNKQKLNFTDSVRLALNEIVGAYGIVAISQDEPDKLIAARLGSPLILGVGDSEYFIASDSSPIINYTRNIIILDEGEIESELYAILSACFSRAVIIDSNKS